MINASLAATSLCETLKGKHCLNGKHTHCEGTVGMYMYIIRNAQDNEPCSFPTFCKKIMYAGKHGRVLKTPEAAIPCFYVYLI